MNTSHILFAPEDLVVHGFLKETLRSWFVIMIYNLTHMKEFKLWHQNEIVYVELLLASQVWGTLQVKVLGSSKYSHVNRSCYDFTTAKAPNRGTFRPSTSNLGRLTAGGQMPWRLLSDPTRLQPQVSDQMTWWCLPTNGHVAGECQQHHNGYRPWKMKLENK